MTAQVSSNLNKNSQNFSGGLSDEEKVLTYEFVEYYENETYYEHWYDVLLFKGSGVRKAVYVVQLITAWSLAIVLCLLVTGGIEVADDGKSFA